MMLRHYNLDDMSFDEISGRARECISEYFPAWSDYNTHDPGITIIELFAWLTEIQRFHMDRSGSAEPFFPLFGISLQKAAAAETTIELPSGFAPRFIPERTALYAEDVRFETAQDYYYDGTGDTVHVIQRETATRPVILGNARGYPGESFTAETRGRIIIEFELTVAGEVWKLTDSLHTSQPGDRHYTLNRETGEIIFGDGFRGALPYGEVIVGHMAVTLGPNGNIAPYRLTELHGIPVSQPSAARGGVLRETAAEALLRSKLSMRHAVTAEDIERLVLETPGLDVLCVRAFTGDAVPVLGDARVITVAVGLRDGVLTERAKGRIREWLEPYRLVCREFHITAPNVVYISIKIEINVGPHSARFKETLEEAITSFFEKNYSGFGAVLRVSEFCAFLGEFTEVEDVTYCVFRAYGSAKTSADGDVTLAADSLARLGEVSVRLLV